jgi:pimeloyl-ACP methyl ester carboxylesterase
MATYRHDVRRAWDRINSFPAQRLQTRFGFIQYADQGEGLPLLVSHGVLGCHVDTVDSWWADLTGPGFRVIGPSRFGYFGSTLPGGVTPAGQADGYAFLLDHLGVDRAVVIAFPAGSGSALELARRNPRRVTGLAGAWRAAGSVAATWQATASGQLPAHSDRSVTGLFPTPAGRRIRTVVGGISPSGVPLPPMSVRLFLQGHAPIQYPPDRGRAWSRKTVRETHANGRTPGVRVVR